MSKEVAPQVKTVSLSAVKEDLNNGLTKWKKDDIGFGSIEKKYNLLTNEAIKLFGHPEVEKMETRIPTFVIVDDLPKEEPKYEVKNSKAVLAVEPIEKPVTPAPVAKIEIVSQQPIVKPKIEAFI